MSRARITLLASKLGQRQCHGAARGSAAGDGFGEFHVGHAGREVGEPHGGPRADGIDAASIMLRSPLRSRAPPTLLIPSLAILSDR